MASLCGRNPCRLPGRSALRGPLCLLLLFFAWSANGGGVAAATPDSEEVQRLIEGGLAYLETRTDKRLGGQCVIGMAILKATGNRQHKRIAEAIDACELALREGEPYGDVYSNGLAIIFLCELDPDRHAAKIKKLVRGLVKRQKPHGGWGYDNKPTGDTSQTQYGVLSCWEARVAGFDVPPETIRGAMRWLLRTQDPDGAWGYQGIVPEGGGPIQQGGVTINMAVAGMGSLLVCGDLMGVDKIKLERRPSRQKSRSEAEQEIDEFEARLPPAITRVRRGNNLDNTRERGSGLGADRPQFDAAFKKGTRYVNRHFTVDGQNWDFYYLYSLERYKSFEEYLSGDAEEEPKWYNDGIAHIKKRVIEPGHFWSADCGPAVDTAFAILFMIRSMRATLENQGIGGGQLVGGLGLPNNVATSQVQGGRLRSEETNRTIADLLQVLEDPAHPDYQQVVADPNGTFETLRSEFSGEDAARLQRLIRAKEPGVRWLAVTALARNRDLENVPHLLYAFTDPDRRVVLAARDGLRFISRRFDGFGLQDDFSDRDRYDALQNWKNWYRTIVPDADIE